MATTDTATHKPGAPPACCGLKTEDPGEGGGSDGARIVHPPRGPPSIVPASFTIDLVLDTNHLSIENTVISNDEDLVKENTIYGSNTTTTSTTISSTNSRKVDVAVVSPGPHAAKTTNSDYDGENKESVNTSSTSSDSGSPALSIELDITAGSTVALKAVRGGGEQVQQLEADEHASKEALMLRYMQDRFDGHNRDDVSTLAPPSKSAHQQQHQHGARRNHTPLFSSPPSFPYVHLLSDSEHFAGMHQQTGVVSEDNDDEPVWQRKNGQRQQQQGQRRGNIDEDDSGSDSSSIVSIGTFNMLSACHGLSFFSDDTTSSSSDEDVEWRGREVLVGFEAMAKEAEEAFAQLWEAPGVEAARPVKLADEATDMKRAEKLIARDAKATTRGQRKQVPMVESLQAIVSKQDMVKTFLEKEAELTNANTALTASNAGLQRENASLRVEVARLRAQLSAQDEAVSDTAAGEPPRLRMTLTSTSLTQEGGVALYPSLGSAGAEMARAEIVTPPRVFSADSSGGVKNALAIVPGVAIAAAPAGVALGDGIPATAQSCVIPVVSSMGAVDVISIDTAAAPTVSAAEPSGAVVAPSQPTQLHDNDLTGDVTLTSMQQRAPLVSTTDGIISATSPTADPIAAVIVSSPAPIDGSPDNIADHPDQVRTIDAATRPGGVTTSSISTERLVQPRAVVHDISSSVVVPATTITPSIEIDVASAAVCKSHPIEPATEEKAPPVASPPVAILTAATGTGSSDTSADSAFTGSTSVDTLASKPAEVPLEAAAAAAAAAAAGNAAAGPDAPFGAPADFARFDSGCTTMKEAQPPSRAAEMGRTGADRFGFNGVTVSARDVRSPAFAVRATPGNVHPARVYATPSKIPPPSTRRSTKVSPARVYATPSKNPPPSTRRSTTVYVDEDMEKCPYCDMFSPLVERELKAAAHGTLRYHRAFGTTSGHSGMRRTAGDKEKRTPAGPSRSTTAITTAAASVTVARFSTRGDATARTTRANGSHSPPSKARPIDRAAKIAFHVDQHIATSSATAAAVGAQGVDGVGGIRNTRRATVRGKESASGTSSRVLPSASRTASAANVPVPHSTSRREAAPAQPARTTRFSTRRSAAERAGGRDIRERKAFMKF